MAGLLELYRHIILRDQKKQPPLYPNEPREEIRYLFIVPLTYVYNFKFPKHNLVYIIYNPINYIY